LKTFHAAQVSWVFWPALALSGSSGLATCGSGTNEHFQFDTWSFIDPPFQNLHLLESLHTNLQVL
jgi:hypothetical protein